MRKRAITLTLALLLCLSCALPASASSGSKFTDVPDNAWYAEAVNAMADGGILNGKGNGIFDPDAPVTLAELATIYCRLRGKEVKSEYGHWAGSAMRETELGADVEIYYVDYMETWYWEYDKEYTEFPYADSPAYRADAFHLLAGWLYGWHIYNDPLGEDKNNLADYFPSYSDFDKSKIPDRDEYYAACYESMYDGFFYRTNGHNFFARDIDYAYDLGLTHGVDANFTCNALGTLTRAQLAQMCYNMGWTSADAYASFSSRWSPWISID